MVYPPALEARNDPHGLSDEHNTFVDINRPVDYVPSSMNASELRRWLKKQECTFHTHKGGSGHVTVRRGDRTSQLPMHGARKELGAKLVAKIKRDLGLT